MSFRVLRYHPHKEKAMCGRLFHVREYNDLSDEEYLYKIYQDNKSKNFYWYPSNYLIDDDLLIKTLEEALKN